MLAATAMLLVSWPSFCTVHAIAVATKKNGRPAAVRKTFECRPKLRRFVLPESVAIESAPELASLPVNDSRAKDAGQCSGWGRSH